MKDALGAVQSILVLGGASDIGIAIASQLAGPRRATVVLAGRHPETLEPAASAVRAAGAGRVETLAFDAVDTDSHEAVIAAAAQLVGGDLDVVVLAFGLLGDQVTDEAGGDGAVRLAQVNYVGGVSAGLAVGSAAQGSGPRHPRRTVVGRRRTGAAGQLHLRLLQGRSRRLRPGAGRRPRRQRSPGTDRAAGLRPDQAD